MSSRVVLNNGTRLAELLTYNSGNGGLLTLKRWIECPLCRGHGVAKGYEDDCPICEAQCRINVICCRYCAKPDEDCLADHLPVNPSHDMIGAMKGIESCSDSAPHSAMWE